MTAHETSIIIERDGHIATITLNRPAIRNAVNLAMLELFERELDRIGEDLPRVVIVQATAPGSTEKSRRMPC